MSSLIVFLSDAGGELILKDPLPHNSGFCSHFTSRQSVPCNGMGLQNQVPYNFEIEADDPKDPPTLFGFRVSNEDGSICVPPSSGSALLMYNMHADGVTVWDNALVSSCLGARDEMQWMIRMWQRPF